MSKTAIEIKGLSKMYKLYARPIHKIMGLFGLDVGRHEEYWALRQLDLTVPCGQRLGIIGRNGAGKSTLLKVISGNIEPTEGSVRVEGKVSALLELGTGFHPEFTGRQNIKTSLAYHGYSGKEIDGMEDEIIDFAELEEFIDQPIKTYSAGMYARLAFSASTALRPEILIIDEVLGAGDAYFAGKCVERMRRLTEDSGATVLFVSHDLGSVQRLCERVIWVDRGRIISDGAPLDVTKRYYVSIIEQEERRLRARNLRIKGAGSKDMELTFRLSTVDAKVPRLSHPVTKITLTGPKGYSQSVEPGSPMDNDRSHPAYLLTNTEFMNWGRPVKLDGVMARSFEDTGGRYNHAPFVFIMPEGLLPAGSPEGFNLEITHSARFGEDIFVEYYHENEYRRLKRLTPAEGRWITESFPVFEAMKVAEDEETVVLEKAAEAGSAGMPGIEETGRVRDKWGSLECEFVKITPSDESGTEKVIFSSGEGFTFNISAKVLKSLPSCWLIVVIYDSNGSRVALLTKDMGPLRPGVKRMEVAFLEPNLRQGEFIVSIALQPSYDPLSVTQQPYYALWDRCVMLRIDEAYTGNIPLGLVNLKERVKVTDEL